MTSSSIVVSKDLRRVFFNDFYDHLENYLIQNSLLHEFQSGFRNGFSTDTCIIHLIDYACILFMTDKGQLLCTILLNL